MEGEHSKYLRAMMSDFNLLFFIFPILKLSTMNRTNINYIKRLNKMIHWRILSTILGTSVLSHSLFIFISMTSCSSHTPNKEPIKQVPLNWINNSTKDYFNVIFPNNKYTAMQRMYIGQPG